LYVNYTHVKCTFDSNLLVSVSVAVCVAVSVDVAAGGIGKVVSGSFMVAIN